MLAIKFAMTRLEARVDQLAAQQAAERKEVAEALQRLQATLDAAPLGATKQQPLTPAQESKGASTPATGSGPVERVEVAKI